MIQSILEQVRDFVASITAGALAPFAWVWDFATQMAPLWLLVLAIVALCVLAGWFFGATVRWFLGWVVTAVLSVAIGATWQWLRDRARSGKPKPKPPSEPRPPDPSPPWWPFGR